MMKKLILFFSLILSGLYAFSQGHLDGIIVEKVPVTAAANAADPSLPLGATAYRVFVDMASGWELQNVNSVAAHAMIIGTSTSFYNNIDGTTLGRAMGNAVFNNAAGRFDSYVTIGALTSTRVGILASEDADGTVDGYTVAPTIAPVTLGETFETQFGTSNFSGTFTTNAGIYGVNGGVVGTTANNRVLIGQFTTDGDFNFELNVQIRLVGTGTVENFVARNPVGAEIQFPGLIYTSVVIAPVVSITAPANNTTVLTGAAVTLTANATDADGTVSSVEFRRNGASLGFGVQSGNNFSLNWTATVGSQPITAIAIDNVGNPTTSAPLTITVNNPVFTPPTVSISSNAPVDGVALVVAPAVQQHILFTAVKTDGTAPVTSIEFKVNGVSKQTGLGLTYDWTPDQLGDNIPVTVTVTSVDGSATASTTVKVYDGNASYDLVDALENCNLGDNFCITLATQPSYSLLDVTGFDFTVIYDATKVRPTRQIDVLTNVGGANNNNTAYTTNVVGNKLGNDTMYVSMYLDGASVAADGWDGTGALFCIGFAKISATAFPADGSAIFSMADLRESKVSGVSNLKVVQDGTYTTFKNTEYTGFVKFWSDFQPMDGVGGIATRVTIGSNPTVITNAAGEFVANFGLGTDMNMTIRKQVDNNATALVLPDLYSGQDAYLTAQYTANIKTFTPSAQQVIAMDVNRDGVVSAGDISQINQRSVKAIDQFTTAAVPVTHFDWVFYNEDAPLNEASWASYSKFAVPAINDVFDLSTAVANPTTCPVIVYGNNTYYGIALGDVDGSWADITATGTGLKSTSGDQVIFDLANAYTIGEYVDVPLMVSSESKVNSMNFVVEVDKVRANVESVSNRTDYIEFNSNASEQYFAISSYSVSKKYEVGKPLMYLHVYAPQGLLAEDVLQSAAWINGKKATTALASSIKVDGGASVRIYPNPVAHILTIETPQEVTLQMFDALGKAMIVKAKIAGTEKIDVRGLSSGVYTLKISNSNFTTVKQIVITK